MRDVATPTPCSANIATAMHERSHLAYSSRCKLMGVFVTKAYLYPKKLND